MPSRGCRTPLRIDIMANLRGVAPFNELWERRTTIEPEGEVVDMLSIEDLVQAKKTQRDKDWPMIRRLVERSYFSAERTPASDMVEFWMRELRSADLLIQVTAEQPIIAARLAVVRPAVAAAIRRDSEVTTRLLVEEEMAERESDRLYREPLKRELEDLRRQQRLPRQN